MTVIRIRLHKSVIFPFSVLQSKKGNIYFQSGVIGYFINHFNHRAIM